MRAKKKKKKKKKARDSLSLLLPYACDGTEYLFVPWFSPPLFCDSPFDTFHMSNACFLWSWTERTVLLLQNAVEQPPKFTGRWVGAYVINAFVVVWVLVVGFGFGGWASVTNFVHQIDTFGLFTKCYQCPPQTALPPQSPQLLNVTRAPPPHHQHHLHHPGSHWWLKEAEWWNGLRLRDDWDMFSLLCTAAFGLIRERQRERGKFRVGECRSFHPK